MLQLGGEPFHGELKGAQMGGGYIYILFQFFVLSLRKVLLL